MRKGSKNRTRGKGPVDILEEAVHLLRSSPLPVLASYYIGSAPFMLGLLFFWEDMAHSAFAYARCAQGALVLALLFLWMKCWQAVFATELMAELRAASSPQWTLRRGFRLAAIQSILQPTGLFVLPMAAMFLVPLGRMYGFYQNALVLCDGENDDLRRVAHRSWQVSGLWPKQNLIIMWLISPLMLILAAMIYLVMIPVASVLSTEFGRQYSTIYAVFFAVMLLPLSPFGVVIAVNIALTLFVVPELVKSFLGMHGFLGQGLSNMPLSTTAAVTCGVAYLCMDPITKAAYVLRCFYGESLITGEDLRAQLKRAVAAARSSAVLLMALALTVVQGRVASAAPNPSEESSPRLPVVNSVELNRAIEEVLQERQYSWRLPRERPDERPGFLWAFLAAIRDTVWDIVERIAETIDRILEWIGSWFPQRGPSVPSGDWVGPVRMLLYVLTLALACVLGVLIWQLWRQHGPRVQMAKAVPLQAVSVADEDVGADELPEDSWLAMARELMARGQLRLALRALFLAMLARLARHNLIYVAKFKSNRDYQRELQRRSHAEPEVLEAFRQNVALFERSWYGFHEVSEDVLMRFTEGQERIRAHAQGGE